MYEGKLEIGVESDKDNNILFNMMYLCSLLLGPCRFQPGSVVPATNTTMIYYIILSPTTRMPSSVNGTPYAYILHLQSVTYIHAVY